MGFRVIHKGWATNNQLAEKRECNGPFPRNLMAALHSTLVHHHYYSIVLFSFHLQYNMQLMMIMNQLTCDNFLSHLYKILGDRYS